MLKKHPGDLFSKYNMLVRQPPRPLCEYCNMSLAKANGKSKHGFTKWHKYCVDCSKAAYNPKQCQLDIVYKDGNKKNKERNNLKTLCANCNRLHQKKVKEKHKSILNITVDTDYTL